MNDDILEVVSELERSLAAKRLVEAGMDQVRWSFVFACRCAGCSDGNGRKRVQYRLVLCKLFQGFNRERKCWKTDGLELSHTEVVSSTRKACRLFVNCSQEPDMDDWEEDGIKLHYIEKGLPKFEGTDRETQEWLLMFS